MAHLDDLCDRQENLLKFCQKFSLKKLKTSSNSTYLVHRLSFKNFHKNIKNIRLFLLEID